MEIDSVGDLLLNTPTGPIRQRRPVIYQDREGARDEVAGAYYLKENNAIGYLIGDYDRTRPLIIDPVRIYSTPLGRSGSHRANGIAIDSAGNAYMVGTTDSIDFPIRGALQGSNGGSIDTFVAK